MKLRWTVYLGLAFFIGLTISLLVRSNRRWEATKHSTLDQSLYLAARAGDLPAVRASVEAGADVDGTSLSQAMLGGNVEAVRYLLDHGANPNVGRWYPPLIELCWYNFWYRSASVIPMAKLLLEHGADPNARKDGYTPLAGARQGVSVKWFPTYGLEDADGVDLVTLLKQHGAHD